MNKLKAFIKLDFITVKPYFTIKNLLIYLLLFCVITAFSGSLAPGMGVGMMLGTVFMSYPFAVGEKSNMDALYATLSVDRKTVVLGRYIFAMLLNAVAMLISWGFGAIGSAMLHVLRVTESNFATTLAISLGETFGIVLALFLVFAVIQFTQLPVYFKLGYTKAKLMSFVPLLVIIAIFPAASYLLDTNNLLPAFYTLAADARVVATTVILVLLVAGCISYRLSLAFYRKREF